MIKLLSATVSIFALAALSYAAGQHTGRMNGILQGCQKLLDVAISEDFEPTCKFVNQRLAIKLTHPVSKETKTTDLETGEIVQ